MNITKEQIKKFWEWCGFKLMEYDGLYYNDAKIIKNGKFYCKYLELTLDNIYEYAITKLQDKGYVIDLIANECSGFRCHIDSVINHNQHILKYGDNPVECLFNAIYEVIENENK